jgi:hypothetical protein
MVGDVEDSPCFWICLDQHQCLTIESRMLYHSTLS